MILKIILQKLFVSSSFALMLLGVYFAYLEYDLFRVEVGRQNDPLIQYSFEDDKNAFVVLGGSDIEIKEVAWLMPSVAASVPVRINKHPRILTLQDLIKQLYDDSASLFSGFSPVDREYFIKCRLLSDSYSSGIPLVAEVTFRQRGVKDLSHARSLVYAQWLASDNPFIDVYEENASEGQGVYFITKALTELKERFTAAVGMTGTTDARNRNIIAADTEDTSVCL